MSRWEAHHFCTSCKKHLIGYTICYAIVCPHCGAHPLHWDTKPARWVVDSKPTWWQWLCGQGEKGHWEYKDE